MSAYETLLAFLKPFAEGADGYIGFTKADRSQENSEENKRWGAFVNWYGECGNGEVNLPFEALSENSRWEYYFTPAVLSEDSRLQSKFQHSNAIWIDFDEYVEWETFDPAPSIVVQTSEEKFHCYWLVEEPITDVNDMRYWCKRFLEYFAGGDESGFDATQLLKLPWGLNLKMKSRNTDGTPWAPKVIRFEPDLKYAETAFSHIPEPSAPPVEAPDLSAVPDLPELEFSWQHYLDQYRQSIPTKVVNKLKNFQEGGEEKRSGVLYNLICDLIKVLDTPTEVYSVLLNSPNDKWTADKGASGAIHLWKDIHRVVIKKDKEKAAVVDNKNISSILNSSLPGHEKAVLVEHHVMSELKKTGKFVQTTYNEFFYVDLRNEVSAKLYGVSKTTETPFAGLIRTRFNLLAGTNGKHLSDIFHSAISECQLSTKVEFHRLAAYDVLSNKVYVDRYDGTMYVLNGETVESQPYGTDGIYFYPNENNAFPKTFEYTPEYREGGLDALILDGPNFTTQGNQVNRKELRHLLKTWIASFFFPTIMSTKPIVLIHGAADSGKTTLFQNLSIMLTGDSTFSVTEIPKDTKEFNTQVSQSSYIFYDNVEVNKKEMQEKLAQVATGYTVKLRKLYTTNELVSVKSISFVGITSRTIDRIQNDVVERYIILPVHPFSASSDHTRRSMSSILKEVMESRDALWSELIDFVNKLVKQISRYGITRGNTGIRMADYGSLLELTSNMMGLSPSKMEKFISRMQAEVINENDPIFKALTKLMESPGHSPETRYSSKALYEALLRSYRKMVTQYATSNKFSYALKGYISNGQLERAGIRVVHSTSGNNNYFTVEDIRNEEHFD